MATKTVAAKKTQAMQVSVVVRVRPLLPHEKQQPLAVRVARAEKHNLPSLVTLSSQLEASSSEPPVEFAFEKCYDEATPQRILYQREISQAVTDVLAGVNTTVFAYGATGAGKTFTMEGSKKNLGMIPRCIKQLFELAEESNRNAQVTLSYLEIYNDRIRDLLVAKAQGGDLPIRQQVDGSISVHGLSKKRIATLQEFEDLYEKGSASRKKAATELNHESSRSHSILMVHVKTKDEASGETRTGKLHLIDLAGCEDNRRTGNSGVRLAESGKINVSLFVLGKVIAALNSGDLQRIPFRDSKLTRLLQDSLGGSSHAVMICNVSPIMAMYQETLQTLTYAYKARGIVNDVAINRSPNQQAASSGAATVTKPAGLSSLPRNVNGKKTILAPKSAASTIAVKAPAEAKCLPKSAPPLSASKNPNASRQSALAMEEKLSAWRQSKGSTRASNVEGKKSSSGGKSAIGSGIGAKRTATTPSAIALIQPSAVKKPRLSASPSAHVTSLTTPIASDVKKSAFSASARSAKAAIVTGSPPNDKENKVVSEKTTYAIHLTSRHCLYGVTNYLF